MLNTTVPGQSDEKKFSLLQKSWLDLYNYIQVIRNKLEVPQVSQDYE